LKRYLENGDVNIYLIRISDNPVSMWYAGMTKHSWNVVGYDVNPVEAVTPKTMGNDLSFGLKTYGDGEIREFTSTEKAVFYSHYKIWQKVKEDRKPAIVLEHDALYVSKDKINHCVKGYDSVMLSSHCPAASYFLYPKAAEDLCKTVEDDEIYKNVDFYITDRMLLKFDNHSMKNWPLALAQFQIYVEPYEDKELGTTIEH